MFSVATHQKKKQRKNQLHKPAQLIPLRLVLVQSPTATCMRTPVSMGKVWTTNVATHAHPSLSPVLVGMREWISQWRFSIPITAVPRQQTVPGISTIPFTVLMEKFWTWWSSAVTDVTMIGRIARCWIRWMQTTGATDKLEQRTATVCLWGKCAKA